jgi:hypothetical protein
LLEDGQPVTEPPKDDRGQLILPDLSVAVNLYGAVINVPTEFMPSNRVYSGGESVPIFDHHTPYPLTNIYAPSGVGQDRYDQSTIDLSKGSAKFELNYFGLRYSPYLQLTFLAGYSVSVNTAKTLCFADQVSSNIPKTIDNLYQQAKKEFYYSVSSTPVQLDNNKTTRIKLEVTARDAKTNKTDTNPYQRIEINAVSLGQMLARTGTDRTKLDEPVLTYKPRGQFVLADPTNPKIEQQMLLQTVTNKDSYTYAGAGSTNTVFTDLVDGKATLYYDFNGVDDSLNTPLTFVIQPANFKLNTIVWGVDQHPLSAASNRSKKNLILPEKPAQFIGNEINPQLNTPDLPTTETPDFLYQTWQASSIRELVYTVYPVPVGEVVGNWWGKALARLAIWQILIVLFGGLMLAWQLRQQKNRNKTNDGQIK